MRVTSARLCCLSAKLRSSVSLWRKAVGKGVGDTGEMWACMKAVQVCGNATEGLTGVYSSDPLRRVVVLH